MPNPLYLVECNYGRLGNAFRETDRDSNSRQAVIDLIRTGEVTPIKILEVDEDSGTCRDVTREILEECAEVFCTVGPSFDRQAQAFDHARKHREGTV